MVKIFDDIGLIEVCDTFCDGDWIESKDQSTSGVRLIQTGNVGVGRFLDRREKSRYISEETFSCLSCTEILPNDVLVSRLPEPAGRACLLPDNLGKAITAVDCTIIRFVDYNPKVFVAFTQTHSYQSQIDQMLGGSTRQRISRRELGKIKVPLIDIEEQNLIAEVLEDANGLIEALEKLIAKKFAIRQGVMRQLLTKEKRLHGFTSDWTQKKVGKIGKFYSGLSGKTAIDFEGGSSKYITFLNVLSNIVVNLFLLENVCVREGETQNKVLLGDLFFNTSSETPEEVGKCAVLLKETDDTYLNSFCFGFRLSDKDIDPLFLSYFFNSDESKKIMMILAQGATRYNLSKSYFREIEITVPPKKEQEAIAQVLSDMDAEIATLTTKLEKARMIKQGMMQQLLTGNIRLVEVAAEDEIAATVTVETKKPTHTKEFEDAIGIAAIVGGWYHPQYTLGRVKVTKLKYLLDRKRNVDVLGYSEMAAGPYDPSVRYSGGEAVAQKKGYITVTQTKGKGASFGKGSNIADIGTYIDSWGMRATITWLINNFKTWKKEELEVLATVDSARLKLEEQGQEVTVQNIVTYILQSPEWKAKRDRDEFADEVIEDALKTSLQLFGGIA